MEPEEQTEAQEQATTPEEPPGQQTFEEIDLGTPEEPPPEAPQAPKLAEPGVYVCTKEHPGDHSVLGIVTVGEEYDYSHADPHTLQAVAAYVELGVLEKM